jgi:hypothetical protein
LLVGLGHAAAAAGFRVCYFTAADPVETLYRGLADNSVGRVIDSLLRSDLLICDELGFTPLDTKGSQPLFRFVAAAYERRSLGRASHWPSTSGAGSARPLHHRLQGPRRSAARGPAKAQPGGAGRVLKGPRRLMVIQAVEDRPPVATSADFELAKTASFEMAIDT